MTIRAFLLAPATVFAAQVNQAGFSYPLGEVAFDGVTTGAYTDIVPGMTVLFGTSAGADDLGRQRVRKAATSAALYIGRSSRGVRDGEVDLQDDAYITVLDDYRVWAKIPYITDGGTGYKDHDLVVSDRTEDIPPVANTGPGTAGTIDATSGKLRVQLPPGGSNESFANVGSLSSYLWGAPSGASLVAGYASSDAIVQMDFDPGFYMVPLTVTDSNGKTHTARCPVYARDPDSDTTISGILIDSHVIRPEGQLVNLRILEDIPAGATPDGTLVMLWEDEPSDPADRSHMIFVGWHHTDPAAIRAERTGMLRDVTLECRDVAGKLDALPGFEQTIDSASSPDRWTEMASPNMDKYLHYLLHWHSTALEVADWTNTGTGSNYPFVTLGSNGESLYDQVDRRARALVPDYRLTCNRLGQLQTVVDPMLQDSGDRASSVQATLDEGDWAELSYTQQRPPRIYWLDGNAILASSSKIAALFCRAPGDAPGQGESAQDHGEQLARSQSALNACEGHRYARLNAVQTTFAIALRDGAADAIEPADLTWVRLTMTAATAAERGLAFTAERGLPVELSIRYDFRREGLLRTPELTWERETSGTPAVTVIQPPNQIADWSSIGFPPWEPWDFDPFPEGGEGFMPAITLADSPALYLVTRDTTLVEDRRILRTRTPDSLDPHWEVVLTAADIWAANAVFADFVLDSWSPKLAAYALLAEQGGAANTERARVYYIDDLNEDAGLQSVSLLWDSFADGGIPLRLDWRGQIASSINLEGAVSGVIWTDQVLVQRAHHFRRTSYAGGFSDVDLGALDPGRAYTSYPYALGHHASGPSSGRIYTVRSTGGGALSTNFGGSFDPLAIGGAGPANDVHVPYWDNPGDAIVYYGRENNGSSTGGIRRRNEDGSWSDIAPPHDGDYAYLRDQLAFHTYTQDRLRLTLAADGPTLWTSEDGGDSFVQRSVPAIATSFAGARLGGWPFDYDILFAWTNTLQAGSAASHLYVTKDLYGSLPGNPTWHKLTTNVGADTGQAIVNILRTVPVWVP